MTEPRKSSLWSLSGLRTRFVPKSRIGQGLVSMAPWLDVVVLLILFAIIEGRVVLQPGIAVDLPAIASTSGSRAEMVLVVLAVKGANGGPNQELVFYDDERFFVSDKDEMESLKQNVAAHLSERPDANMILQADAAVPHGVVVRMVNMASEVGVRNVTIATRSE